MESQVKDKKGQSPWSGLLIILGILTAIVILYKMVERYLWGIS